MSTIINLIYEYGLIAMFIMILLEYACFPVSSEIVLPFSGAVASINGISFFFILPVSVVAGLIGTSICYFIGRFGGSPILDQLTKKWPKTKSSIDSSYEKFDKYGAKAVCIGRVIPLCRTYIAFVAGAVKQDYSKFLSASAIGITMWNIVLIGLGYVLRENWSVVGYYYEEYKLILLPILLLLLLILLIKVSPLKKYFFRREH